MRFPFKPVLRYERTLVNFRAMLLILNYHIAYGFKSTIFSMGVSLGYIKLKSIKTLFSILARVTIRRLTVYNGICNVHASENKDTSFRQC